MHKRRPAAICRFDISDLRARIVTFPFGSDTRSSSRNIPLVCRSAFWTCFASFDGCDRAQLKGATILDFRG